MTLGSRRHPFLFFCLSQQYLDDKKIKKIKPKARPEAFREGSRHKEIKIIILF
jgi:hypothetical protein